MKIENQKLGSLFRVAIVGAASLKGKELKEVLEERNFPAVDIRLLDDSESLGQLDSVQDEVAFVQPVGHDQLENIDFTFFACDEEFTRANWKLARETGSAVVDLSYGLEQESSVPVCAPWIERELGQQAQFDLESTGLIIAHPAAIVLALLMLRAQKTGPIRYATATVFEPVSEQGRRGMDELHEQTINLLSFQQMPTAVFDSQVAFNLTGRYGKASSRQLETIERRIGSHLRQMVEGRVPLPSLTLLQAPVFHGYTFSLYIELEKNVSTGDFSQAMSGEHIELAHTAEDFPSNVNVAGKDNILLSVRRDTFHANGFWLWAAADNLRLAAITAVDCASALAAVRPHGKVQ